jgi:hypothetical protein
MKPVTFFRKTHKWAMLVIGVQAVLWTLGGVYMTVIPLPVIHGNHLMAENPPAAIDWARVEIEPGLVALANPTAHAIRLTMVDGAPAYQVTGPRQALISAETGRVISPVPEDAIRRMARADFAGDAEIRAVTLLETGPMPQEILSTRPPVWRVDFEGWNEPTFYYSAETGRFLSRRHNLWRGFDIAWMLHIMDYDERADMDNWLLRVATALGLFSALTGMGLVFYSFARRRRAEAA